MKQIEEHQYWWLGENRQFFTGEEVLIRLNYPRCLIRYKLSEAYFATFEEWKNKIIDVQWLDGEKPTQRDQNDIILEGWNFLAIEEKILEDDMTNMAIDDWEEEEWE